MSSALREQPREHQREPLREPLRDRWEAAAIAAELETGAREETTAEARSHVHRRMLRIAGGTLVTLLGVLLWPLPGPGTLTVCAGLAILARDVPWAHRLLVRLRRRLPQGEDGKLTKPAIATMAATSCAMTAASVWVLLA